VCVCVCVCVKCNTTSLQKKNNIFPFAATWMNLQDIVLSEISQTETNTEWSHLYVNFEKCSHLVNITKRSRFAYKEQTSGCQWGEGRGHTGVEEWEVQTIECKAGLKMHYATLGI